MVRTKRRLFGGKINAFLAGRVLRDSKVTESARRAGRPASRPVRYGLWAPLASAVRPADGTATSAAATLPRSPASASLIGRRGSAVANNRSAARPGRHHSRRVSSPSRSSVILVHRCLFRPGLCTAPCSVSNTSHLSHPSPVHYSRKRFEVSFSTRLRLTDHVDRYAPCRVHTRHTPVVLVVVRHLAPCSGSRLGGRRFSLVSLGECFPESLFWEASLTFALSAFLLP